MNRHRHVLFGAALVAVALVIAVGASAAGAFVYWADSDHYQVGRANLDGTGEAASFVKLGVTVCGVAAAGGYVYWGDWSFGRIGRARIDGVGKPSTAFVSGSTEPCGVAVYGHYLYWTNGEAAGGVGSVGRADLNNPHDVRENFVPNERATGGSDLDRPCGVAVDATGIYWGSIGNNSIGHANLDGTGERTIITGAGQPCGVALGSGHVFWANQSTGTIGQALISGASPDENYITGQRAPCGLAVYSGYLYWANAGPSFGNGTITRTPISGADPTAAAQDIIGGLAAPCGVAVDGLYSGTLTIGRPHEQRNGSIRLPLQVSNPGTIVIGAARGQRHLLTTLVRHVGRAGGVRVTLSQTRLARRLLRAGHGLRERVAVTYTPAGGIDVTKTATISLTVKPR